jgi:hypothetical protein
LSFVVEANPTAQKPEFRKISWQVVKNKRPQPQEVSDANRQQERRSLYLHKMKGLCFNCLAQDHKVTSCRDPTRCWRCRQFGHTFVECSSTQAPNTKHSHFSKGAPAPPLIELDIGSLVDDILPLMCSPPPASSETAMDPMLFEALLIGQRSDVERGTSTHSCVANQNPSDGEIDSPVLLRSEAEQLVGQELIKTLSDFKQLEPAPSPPNSAAQSTCEGFYYGAPNG